MTTSHRIAEGVVLCLLFFAYPLRGQLSAPEILQKVGRAYQDLQAFSMEASSSTSFLAGHVSTYTTTHYELAVVRPGKLRLRVNNPDRDLTMISDGETTWTYDARRKEYTEESVAAFAAEEEEEEAGSDEERDVFSESQRMLVARYAALPRLAPNARPDRDDHIKVGGKQLACYVLEVRTT